MLCFSMKKRIFYGCVFAGIMSLILLFSAEDRIYKWVFLGGAILMPLIALGVLFWRIVLDEERIQVGLFFKGTSILVFKDISYEDIEMIAYYFNDGVIRLRSFGEKASDRCLIAINTTGISNWQRLVKTLVDRVPHEKVHKSVFELIDAAEKEKGSVP